MRADPDALEVYLTSLASHGRYRGRIAELEREVELWKDRETASRQALEATIENYEEMLRDGD